MSPPFFNFNRRLPALATLARLQHFAPTPREPDNGPVEMRRRVALDSFSSQAANEATGPGNNPEITLSIAEARARAGELGEYAASLNFRALRLRGTHSPDEQAEIRNDAFRWAEEALSGIANSRGFARDRVRALYDCVLALSSILSRPGREELPEPERQLLLNYFVQIRAGIEQHRIEIQSHPEYEPIPNYFESYARAEQALLEGHAGSALAAFLETRRNIHVLPGTGTFRGRVEAGTEYAIRAMQSDSSGTFLENLRGRWNLEILLLLDQVDGGSPAEAQALSLAALSLAEGELRGASARGLMEHLRRFPSYGAEQRLAMVQELERICTEQPEFLRASREQLHLDASATPRQISESLLAQASTAAQRILSHANRDPYATVLRRDAENRPLREAVEQLQNSPELRAAIQDLLGLRAASPSLLTQNLVEYGPLATVLLESLPAALRNQAAYSVLSRSIRQVADSNDSEGRRRLFEQPMEELLESLGTLSRDDDHYAPAYEHYFGMVAESTRASDSHREIPENIRSHAQALRAAITDFNGRRLARHLFSSDSLLSLAGGIALTELMPIGLLHWARRSRTWVQAGRLTWQSELAVGLGVGLTMSTVGAAHHLATSPRPLREELPRILPTLALNTLFSSLAMGGTTLLSHRLRGALLNEETQSYLLLRHLGLRAGTTGGGGLLMLGASSLSERFSTGHWRAPRSEEIAETYANMLMWDAGAAGLRRIGNRFWWRAQLGPRLMRRRIQPLVSELMNRNPWLAQTPREQRALENYVGGRLASGQSIEAMELGLQDGLEPYWHQGEISFRPRTPVVRAPRPAGESPVASGRRRDVADEAVPPDQALPVENSPMDDIHNVPLEVLQGLWSLPMRPLPREILSSPLLRPIHQLRVGRQSFYLGRVIEGVRQRSSGGSESRRYVLALVPVEVDGRQVLKRRFFYVSSSDAGAWRSSPFMMGNAHIMKGMGRHYTQETQPVWEIAQALMRLEQRGPAPTQMPLQDLTRYISLSSEALGEAGERTMIAGFGQEIEFPAVPGTTALQAMQPGEVFALPPGWGWGSSKSIEATLRQMVNLRWPDGFIPDFTQAPTREMRQPTSLLGPLTFREYRGASIGDPSTGRRRPLVWIMGEDGQGRTWVRHLHYGDSEVNSYGVYSDVFDSGVLTSKPLEYADQAALLHEPYSRPFNAEYRDISPALTLLEPIRRYREARGLSPRLTPEDTPTILDINR